MVNIGAYIQRKKQAFQNRNNVEVLRAKKKKVQIDAIADNASGMKKREAKRLKQEIKAIKNAKGIARREKMIKAYKDGAPRRQAILKKVQGFDNKEKKDIFGGSSSTSSPFAVTNDKPMKKKKEGKTITIKIN